MILSIVLCGCIGGNISNDLNLYNSAKSNKDISLCDKINKFDLKKKCYSAVGEVVGDPSICEGIVDKSLQEACYSGVAIAKGDLSLCYDDPCYKKIAVNKKDPIYAAKFRANFLKIGAIEMLPEQGTIHLYVI